MDYKEKYYEALERARAINNGKDVDIEAGSTTCEYIFPELKENEDDRIKKALINGFKDYEAWDEEWFDGITVRTAIAWIEKQGKQSNNEEAEKEKNDYVSGLSLYCKGSFNEFKEGESYWLEYIGNDNYIGRSDNVLNQKFHITPRQLYTWLDPRHDYKHYEDDNDENNAPIEYGKYVDECLNEASEHFFSEGEDKYSVADLFYAGVRCGKSWSKKQDENKSNFSDLRIWKYIVDMVLTEKNGIGNYLDNSDTERIAKKLQEKYGNIEKQSEKLQGKSAVEATKEEKVDNQICIKSSENIEPKFHPGDWITDGRLTCKVLDVTGKSYELHLYNDDYCHFGTDVQSVDKHYHLWSINDAKDGDVLVNGSNIFIFHFINDTRLMGYCHVNIDNGRFYDDIGKNECFCLIDAIVTPATKEQRELLFSKMKQEGCKWDDENKKLSEQPLKITPKFCIGQLITDNYGTWYKILNIECLGDWYYKVYDIAEDKTHLELCLDVDKRFRENRFVDEIKKMMGN